MSILYSIYIYINTYFFELFVYNFYKLELLKYIYLVKYTVDIFKIPMNTIYYQKMRSNLNIRIDVML